MEIKFVKQTKITVIIKLSLSMPSFVFAVIFQRPFTVLSGHVYRAFSHDVTSAILVSQNNDVTSAILVSQNNSTAAMLVSQIKI